MRKVLLSLALAAGTLAVATPAAAQWGRPVVQYGYSYGSPYGYANGYQNGYGYQNAYGYQNGYGYQNNYGQVFALQSRINKLQSTINQLDRRDYIRNREADRLRNASRTIERRLQSVARYGLSPNESYEMQNRIAGLEQRIQRVLYEGRTWRRDDRRWNDFWQDRDRDGRNDRYEDDRGRRHDHH
ncbi:hypothetical protein H8M03_00280 [Sphingomonas sabuli]|uniref:Uncharacterized protein n=1 Tax=Sphingomonas sabuli TaxID=2764186 RepID=A0A7G9L2K1_9SPHN|nr:hypothetical protein [Sphingomonas sabuli]QNM82850.1 hypothetical protein H8M03_00280 [Sphingomonas sabuli]